MPPFLLLPLRASEQASALSASPPSRPDDSIRLLTPLPDGARRPTIHPIAELTQPLRRLNSLPACSLSPTVLALIDLEDPGIDNMQALGIRGVSFSCSVFFAYDPPS